MKKEATIANTHLSRARAPCHNQLISRSVRRSFAPAPHRTGTAPARGANKKKPECSHTNIYFNQPWLIYDTRDASRRSRCRTPPGHKSLCAPPRWPSFAAMSHLRHGLCPFRQRARARVCFQSHFKAYWHQCRKRAARHVIRVPCTLWSRFWAMCGHGAAHCSLAFVVVAQ